MQLTPDFLLFCFIMAFTPGPNNIMIMTSGLNHGVRASVPHLAGISIGVPAMFIAVGLGLREIFLRYPQLHIAIKIIGVLYLIYLSWQIARASAVESKQGLAAPLTFLQSMLFQWVNPKSWLISGTTVAAFTVVGTELLSQILLIALVFLFAAFISSGTWLLFGMSLQKLLKKRRYRHVFNITMAVLLLLSVLPITLKTLIFPQ